MNTICTCLGWCVLLFLTDITSLYLCIGATFMWCRLLLSCVVYELNSITKHRSSDISEIFGFSVTKFPLR